MNNKESGLAHFIKYNNAVPIVLGFLFLGTTASFAASPAVREAVYASDTSVASIDTSYLIAANIEKFPFAMRVTGVSEDDAFYYVSYDLNTIGVIDGVWRAVIVGKELRVSKAQLGEGDLEDFIESELAQVRGSEIARLTETQSYEKRRGVTEKVVATAYRGLVGDLLKPKEERVPQYASELSKNDPLYLRNPVELLTFDANAKVITPRQEEREEEQEEEEDIRPYPAEEDEDEEQNDSSETDSASTTPSEAGTSTPPVEEEEDSSGTSTPPVVEEEETVDETEEPAGTEEETVEGETPEEETASEEEGTEETAEEPEVGDNEAEEAPEGGV